MGKKFPIWWAVGCGVCFLIHMVSFVAVLTGAMTVWLNGFGVDGQGRLYIGMNRRIDIWEDGRLIDQMGTNEMQRGYFLAMPQGTHILICYSDTIAILGLSGEKLDRIENIEYDTMCALKEAGRVHTTADGTTYRSYEGLGGYYITQEKGGMERIIYRMPPFYAALRIIAALNGLAFGGLIVYQIYRGNMKRRW